MKYFYLFAYVVISQIIAAWFDFIYDGVINGGENAVIGYVISMFFAFVVWINAHTDAI